APAYPVASVAVSATLALALCFRVAGVLTSETLLEIRLWGEENRVVSIAPERPTRLGLALREDRDEPWKNPASRCDVDQAPRLRHLLRPLNGVGFIVEALLPLAVERDAVGRHGATADHLKARKVASPHLLIVARREALGFRFGLAGGEFLVGLAT